MRKTVKTLAIVAVLATSTAQAGELGQALGAIIGIGVGSQLGAGNGRTAAMIIGGLVGNELGRDRSPQSQNYNYPPGYNAGPGYYPIAPYGTRNMTVPVAPPVYVNQGPQVYAQVPQPEVIMPPCDEQYYDGEYNPQAARAFCQGQRARIQREMRRQQAEAYRKGNEGY